MTEDRHWHISKEIPISLLATLAGFLIIQTCSIVWAASNVFTRMGYIETQHTVLMERSAQDALKLAIVDERQQNVLKRLSANGDKVDEVLRLLRERGANHASP